MMISRRRITACLLLVSLATDASAASSKLSPSQKYARKVTHQRNKFKQRQLQNDKDNDKNNEGKNDANNGKNDVTAAAPDTEPPTTAPPSQRPTVSPTPRPSLPPSNPPATTSPPDDVWTTPGQTFISNNNNQITMTMDELRDIQFFGGGEITLRFSLWFQDETAASQVVGGGPTQLAVLHSLQALLCRSDAELDQLEGDPLGLNTLNWADASESEEREICVVPLALGGVNMPIAAGGEVEGSVLLQPPTTYVVDRTASNTDLHWTTWRVTWPVLRLGTFYILQGLENAGSDAATLAEEEIYRSGVDAMQGILELALQVSIREQSFDKVLVGAMVQEDQSGGMVLASVYGEEVKTLEPKLEWLGMTSHTTTQQDGELLEPTATVDTEGETIDTSTTSDAATEAAEDDEWDDDHYSMQYGITESLDPDFWHPLRIVGIIMFIFTTATLVSLSCMSRKRQARRDIERKMAKEGLLNNPQSVDDMLRASTNKRTTETTPSRPTETHSKHEDDDKDLSIPMPNSLKVSS